MNPRLQRVQHIFRQMHVLNYVEKARYWQKNIQNRQKNRVFRDKNIDFALPPAHLAFDAHGTIDWESYKQNGEILAERITRELELSTQIDIKAILEWGCGPGRVIRHMPFLLDGVGIYGSDYNVESIDWCKKCIPDVTFEKNDLLPPLPFERNSFDFIYAISVFTHLSESTCLEWINELSRVLNPNGLLMIWTNGDVIADFLLPEEKEKYASGQFVFRGQYKEGRKMFLSFHPSEWVQGSLLKGYQILKHYSGGFSGSEQDIWIARIQK